MSCYIALAKAANHAQWSLFTAHTSCLSVSALPLAPFQVLSSIVQLVVGIAACVLFAIAAVVTLPRKAWHDLGCKCFIMSCFQIGAGLGYLFGAISNLATIGICSWNIYSICDDCLNNS